MVVYFSLYTWTTFFGGRSVGALLDRAAGSDGNMFRDAVCWFYIANEGISLMENLNLAGVPFPKKIQELLGQKKEESGGAAEDTDE